ncbi:aminopeptidase C [Lactococcus nasutitermitis]|uniref:Aminopeptidase n=1 Tax=Lactococcus nasutitermitis TaxID=1652957 RepID=A0ABV9JA03_9LACT|nr:aminopeptidase C [Lactococcus nasutitermitis]
MTLTNDFTQKLYENFAENPKFRAVENAATKNGLLNALEARSSHANNLPEFSIDLTSDPVTNQKQSGRCWMFAAMNTFRHKVINNFKLENFELSQAYPYFWDKYEKSNWFFEQLIENSEMDDRRLKFLLQTPQQDGGQWDMIVAIFEKYGVMPKAAYPESSASSTSRELNQYLNKLLRQDAQLLLDAVKAGKDVAALKESLLQEIFNFLAATLGLPPQEFDFAFRNKDKELVKFSGTPKEFYDQFVAVDLDNYVSIINAPTADKPYNKSYTVEFLGNVVGARDVKHLNVDMSRFKKLAIAQMQQGETVWFGCDVGQVSNRKSGLLTLDAYDFETALDIEFTQDKAGRLDYGESLMTHAMVLAGVDLDENGNSTQWKVENSWGKDAGEFNGYFVASDAWMDEYTYQIVVRKDLLTEEELAAYAAEPQVLLPWDPMGALA